jgi:rhodanese-related sulfurtransferase
MSLALGPGLAAQKVKGLTDPTKVPRMPPAELQKLAAKDQVVLVDVRSAQAYAAGHLDGAVNIPAPEIEARAAELRRRAGKRQVVLYCSCPFEYTAADAAVILARLGVAKVSVLAGGYRKPGTPHRRAGTITGWHQATKPLLSSTFART